MIGSELAAEMKAAGERSSDPNLAEYQPQPPRNRLLPSRCTCPPDSPTASCAWCEAVIAWWRAEAAYWTAQGYVMPRSVL